MVVLSVSGVAALAVHLFEQASYAPRAYSCAEGTVTPVFSPYNSEIIFSLVENAKHEIKLEVYEFSSTGLADALVGAKERGVSVKVVLEPSVYANSATFSYLINSGVEASWASKRFHNTHSKFAVIDDAIVFVGSMNWSRYGVESNREASVVINSQETAAEFEEIFDADFAG
jgi:phosphatidylserine/phosphatidylglycerophosphate/cardiolipin synthase-like enzyme